MGQTFRPLGRTTCPNLAAIRPAGRWARPSGPTIRPTGRRSRPKGRGACPMGRTVCLKGRVARPTGRAARPRRPITRPMGRPVVGTGRAGARAGRNGNARGRSAANASRPRGVVVEFFDKRSPREPGAAPERQRCGRGKPVACRSSRVFSGLAGEAAGRRRGLPFFYRATRITSRDSSSSNGSFSNEP
jgi:hypothetical protein